MKYPISSIWYEEPGDHIMEMIHASIERGIALRNVEGSISVFFRADDIGVPGRQFARLIELFSCYDVPLALAVVPVWITWKRWEVLEAMTRFHAPLWCWHQHGWRHVNHEIQGKKQEFGPQRTRDALEHDLTLGTKRLESILGNHYFKGFTPPWNRCGQACLDLLKVYGYHALSRSRDAQPKAPEGLFDIQVNVDLHTLKESDPQLGWEKLCGELEKSISEGFCGIMIHHQRMNNNAFVFLEMLLKILKNRSYIKLINLNTYSDFSTI